MVALKEDKKEANKKVLWEWQDKDGDDNLCERCVHTGQNCLIHNSRWVDYYQVTMHPSYWHGLQEYGLYL